jgi:hypothetical protein
MMTLSVSLRFQKKEFQMNGLNTQTTTIFQVSDEAEKAVKLLRKRHYYPRIIADFRGPITGPVFSSKGDMVYMEFKEEDVAIIPKAVFWMHDEIRRAGYQDLQVIIGHEIRVAPDKPVIPPRPKRQIDWGNVASVASKGLLVAGLGVVMVPIFALAGAVMLLDPSYCIVLDDGAGTVIELMRWNDEV